MSALPQAAFDNPVVLAAHRINHLPINQSARITNDSGLIVVVRSENNEYQVTVWFDGYMQSTVTIYRRRADDARNATVEHVTRMLGGAA